MNSSESEDFESADEDLDQDISAQREDESEDVKIDACNETDKSENDSSVASSAEISEKLEQVTLKDGPVGSGSKRIPTIGTTPDTKNKSIETLMSNIEEATIKPTVKKLGTEITTNEPLVTPNVEADTSNYIPENKNGKNKERKVRPMKLGMKLKSEVVKDKANIEDSASRVLSDKNEDSKSEKPVNLDNCESSKKNATVDNFDKSQNILKLDETNLEAGDGWDLEEEDGFEIPVTLARTGDGGIQCPQEQICEFDQVEFKPSREVEQEQGWGGWGGWGVGSLLSTATGTVTTFSSQVTAGLSTVLETTVGAPDPETLANQQAHDRDSQRESTKTEDETDPGYGGLGSIMSGVSFLGSSVINRGLDTLETIGKKTMEVLQDGDPGLKKKRAMLFDQDKPILSQILREAKERADSSDQEKEEKEAARKVHYESLFDDFQGMVHLEALEMLSTQCELKLQSLLQSQSGTQLLDLQETLSQVRDLCELAEEEEDAEVLTAEQFAEKVTSCVEGLRIAITPTKIIKVNSEICERLAQVGPRSADVVNQTAISSLAELTAAAMECFHKSAELVMAKPIHNTADESDSYVQLTSHLCARVSAVANEFTQLLTKNDPIANSSFITNIFLEASNSCSYIKNACQLLIPILQVGAVAS